MAFDAYALGKEKTLPIKTKRIRQKRLRKNGANLSPQDKLPFSLHGRRLKIF